MDGAILNLLLDLSHPGNELVHDAPLLGQFIPGDLVHALLRGRDDIGCEVFHGLDRRRTLVRIDIVHDALFVVGVIA